MEWINEVKDTKEQLDAYCVVNLCWDRDESCELKNACGLKKCLNKGCFSFG